MSEVAWVRKYRPSSFDDYMGEDVKKLVMNRFANRENIPNTIMLYGTRGTGKTSMARLMAKEIHCLSPVDGHSCGQCDMCREIDEYIQSTEAGVTCTGITEVDAATVTGKDSINEIIDDAIIPPMWPLTKKILILDECHMLSTQAQNSLLKVIEEPPEHLIFILCTTDPEKVIGTIHSRMQLKIEVRKKTVDEMAKKLEEISKAECLDYSPQALTLIAKRGDRIPRECINLLEQVAKANGNRVHIDDVLKYTSTISTDIYIEYYKAANSGVADILEFIAKLREKDIAPKDFVIGFSKFVLDAIFVKHGVNLQDYSTEFVKSVAPIFRKYNVDNPKDTDYKSLEYDMLVQTVLFMLIYCGTDDSRNEMLIINGAFNIGKIRYLAEGLRGQDMLGRLENINGLRLYKERLDARNKAAVENMPEVDVRKEAFATSFPNMAEVKNGTDILNGQSDRSEAEQKLMGLFGMAASNKDEDAPK